MQPGYDPSRTGERWNVNMPAVIGVVFVFLVGVIVWVIASSGGDDEPTGGDVAATSTSTGEGVAASSTVTPIDTTVPPPETTPTPLPSTTVAPSTVPTTAPSTQPTTAPSTQPTTAPSTAPVTAAPGSDDAAVPGDLAVPGRPMQQPMCDGSYITVLASAIGGQASADSIAAVLDDYPGSNYLRTDQTCPSLTPDVDGEPIYVVYLGPFAFDSDACAARADGPDGAYARRLSTELGPEHSVPCG